MYDRNDRGNRRAQRSEAQQPAEETEGQLEGRNAITEALKSGRTIGQAFHRLRRYGQKFAASGRPGQGGRRRHCARRPPEAGRHVLHPVPPGCDCSGCRPTNTIPLTTFWKKPPAAEKPPLIVICDELSDPPQLRCHSPFRRMRRGPTV